MGFSRRRIIMIAALSLYWPFLFFCTHLPRVPRWVGQVGVSDKIMHYVAYVALTFFIWFAVSPNKKVNWRKAAGWWILFVVVWYGVFDEWLQGYVGRNPDIKDFFADLSGALTALITLSIFSFWPALLTVTGAGIFVWTNFFRAGLAENFPAISLVFHFCAYVFFSLLWTRYIHNFLSVKPPQRKWLIGSLALPVVLLLSFECFSLFAGTSFEVKNVVMSLAGILSVVLTIQLVAMIVAYAKPPSQMMEINE